MVSLVYRIRNGPPPPRQLAVEQTATVMAATGRIAAAIHILIIVFTNTCSQRDANVLPIYYIFPCD